jgi:mannitol/fructose-specific phosphotransferase system IIA component (Ntr-type)
VRLAGGHREVRRDEDHLRTSPAQILVQLGVAQIEADGQPEAPQLGVHHRRRLGAGGDGLALAHPQPGQLHVEQLEFAVTRQQRAVAAQQHAGVVHVIRVVLDALVQAAQQDHHAVARRQLAELADQRAVQRLRRGELAGALAHEQEHLGKRQQLGAFARRARDQRTRGAQVHRQVVARRGLGKRDLHDARSARLPHGHVRLIEGAM